MCAGLVCVCVWLLHADADASPTVHTFAAACADLVAVVAAAASDKSAPPLAPKECAAQRSWTSANAAEKETSTENISLEFGIPKRPKAEPRAAYGKT